jgi:hypothetical protein
MKLSQQREPILKASRRLAQEALDLGSQLAGGDQRSACPGPRRLGAVMTNYKLLKSKVLENSSSFRRPDRLAKPVSYRLSALA